MNRVVYIPLDERPCNYRYPKLLADMTDVEMLIPSKEILGDMKIPANVPRIIEWLESEIQNSDYLIVSIDMLIYGGIVPSRLHELPLEECLRRLEVLKSLKEKNPQLQIYAYNLIMRVPAYSSSEEEPDYYEQYGEKIFRMGWLLDKKEQNLLDVEELKELEKILNEIPNPIKENYFNRRKTNITVTTQVLDMANNGFIDYLIIPLDDNSPFGFTAKEQRQLMHQVDHLNIMDKVNIYPGADEIACTLFARVFCESHKYIPEIFIRYSSTNGPFIIPRYEDRILSESIKSHITSAGGVIVHNERENDIILMVHSPAVGQNNMSESSFAIETRHRTYFSEVNIREFVQAIKYYTLKGKNVALADVAVGNGADHSLMQLLEKQGLLETLMAYAGWNTNGNTMGTVVSHAIISSYYRQEQPDYLEKQHLNSRLFFYSRLIEDWGYQSIVRNNISLTVLPELGITPRYLGDQLPNVTKRVEQLLNRFIEKHLSTIQEGKIKIDDVYLPWKRMFEVGFNLQLDETKVKQ